MTHIDEHTLELYVLGAEEVKARQAEIEAHILECQGCMQTMARMSAFYVEAEKEMHARPQASDSAEKALVRAQTKLQPLHEESAPAVTYRPVTTIQRFQYFVRRHPVVTGSGTFAALAGLAMLANVVTRPVAPIDPNPMYHHYNVEKGLIEIRNANQQELWKLSTKNDLAGDREYESWQRCARTVIKDLDGDGKNEVLTMLPVGDETDASHLKIYNADKSLRLNRTYPEEVKHSEKQYSPNIIITSLLVNDIVEKGKQEIWLNAYSVGRSPAPIIRLDAKGNVIGKFWHFGNFATMYDLDVNGDGKKEIVLTGINDVQDANPHAEFPAIVVLDPSKVVGNGRTATAPKFGFTLSDAEIFYIRIPYSDLHGHYKMNAFVHGIADITDKYVSFAQSNAVPDFEDGFGFTYFFNRDMSVREVKSGNSTDRLHDRLVAEKKLTGKIDATYLENLKNGVRYFDGKEWRKDVVKVNPETHWSTANGKQSNIQ